MKDIVLYAKDDCEACRGRGSVTEAHGETLDCDCPFETCSPSVIQWIEEGRPYSIIPSPKWERMMDEIDRAERFPHMGEESTR